MKNVVQLENGKRAILDTKMDEKLYDSPHNPPNTDTRYTCGSDLFLHICKSGLRVFYLMNWSMWQGSETTLQVISESEAEEFFLDKLSGNEHIMPYDREIKRMAELGFNFLEETA